MGQERHFAQGLSKNRILFFFKEQKAATPTSKAQTSVSLTRFALVQTAEGGRTLFLGFAISSKKLLIHTVVALG